MRNYILDLKSSILTGGYLAFTFTNVDSAMKIFAFIIATGYTARRWYLMEKNNKDATE